MVEIVDEPVVTFGVLIVDDDPAICAVLQRYIERAGGLEVVGTAYTAASGLELASQTCPDVVVLDYDLGVGPSGLDVAMQIRKVLPDSNIVMFSAYLGEGESFEGVDAVHQKDRLTDLASALRQMVGLEPKAAGPTMACASPGCTSKIPLAAIDVRDGVRTVTCGTCGATRRWTVAV